METIFKTDKNGNQRYTSIRVEKLRDGTANIIKATGVVECQKIKFQRYALKSKVDYLIQAKISMLYVIGINLYNSKT